VHVEKSITSEVIAGAIDLLYRSLMTAATVSRSVGDLLRDWRQRRRLSQLDLALEAEVSARHVSFLETGRAQPSREMLLRLADQLEIPLRDRNTLLVAAGFAPVFPERSLDDPALHAAREAIDLLLAGHEPYPAIAIDRHWTLVAANRALGPLLSGISPELLQPPVNVLRLSLHPDGLAPRIANLRQWRYHLLERLRHQVEITADPTLIDLLNELRRYPAESGSSPHRPTLDVAGIVVPLQLRTENGLLTFLSTTTIFGTPVDVTLSELAIESFFPANAETAEVLRGMPATKPPG
jgi:transcriptional regulator with XRE-family HTH domain